LFTIGLAGSNSTTRTLPSMQGDKYDWLRVGVVVVTRKPRRKTHPCNRAKHIAQATKGSTAY